MAEVNNQPEGIAQRREPVRLFGYPTADNQFIVHFDDWRLGYWPGPRAVGAIYIRNHMATIMPMDQCTTSDGALMHRTRVKQKTGRRQFGFVNFAEYYEAKYNVRPEQPRFMVTLSAGHFLSSDLYVILQHPRQRN